MEDIFTRLNQVAEYYGYKKPSEFAKVTGLSHQSSSNYLKGDRTPNAEALSKIQSAFKEVNPDWLLTGNGAMLKTDNLTQNNYTMTLEDEIRELKRRVQFLEDQISFYSMEHKMFVRHTELSSMLKDGLINKQSIAG